MKRKLTINFTRSVTRVSGPPEKVEVVLVALQTESSGRVDRTYLPNSEHRTITLYEETESVVFEVTPSYDPSFEKPILYRLGWRRGYLGKLETREFTMPDRDVNFEDLEGSFVPSETYLTFDDIGIPGKIAGLDVDGYVIDSRGSRTLSESVLTSGLNKLRDEFNDETDRLRKYSDQQDDTLESRLSDASRKNLAALEQRILLTTGTKEEILQLALDAIAESGLGVDQVEQIKESLQTAIDEVKRVLPLKADLVGGRVSRDQLPTEVYSEVLSSPSDDTITSVVAEKGDIVVTPSSTWILVGEDSTKKSSWVKLAALKSGIQSVNGKTGEVITLTPMDIGARDNSPIGLNEISGLDIHLVSVLESYVKKNELGRVDSGLLDVDIPRLDGMRIVNYLGEEIAAAGGVTSVNGKTGDVTLTPELIGARPAGIITITDVKDLQSTLNLKVHNNDTRLTDSRTPKPHAESHTNSGSDPLVLSQSQITGLIQELSSKTPLSDFEDFKKNFGGDPNDPNYTSAAREFAAISLVGAETSLRKADEVASSLQAVYGRLVWNTDPSFLTGPKRLQKGQLKISEDSSEGAVVEDDDCTLTALTSGVYLITARQCWSESSGVKGVGLSTSSSDFNSGFVVWTESSGKVLDTSGVVRLQKGDKLYPWIWSESESTPTQNYKGITSDYTITLLGR